MQSMAKRKAAKAPKASTIVKANKAPAVSSANPLFIALAAVILISLTAASIARNSIYQTTLSLWANITKTSPQKRRAHENYGQALSTAGFLNEALREFNTVLALKDDGSVPMRDLYREIGVVYFRLGLINDSIVAWQKGLTFAPFDPSIMNNLAVAFLQQKRYDEAAASAETALRMDPNMPQLLNTLGEASLAKGDYDKAVKCFLRAIEIDPDTPSRYWNAALALQKVGKYDLAYQYMSAFASKERISPVDRQRAFAFMEGMKKMMAGNSSQ